MLLLPAAAIAWEHVLAGTPEKSPNYKMSEHWWSMLIDVPKCIGCGNCVRACAKENDVPEGYFRTWVERYHVADWGFENPVVDSPDGGIHGFPPSTQTGGKNFFIPKLCNHCVESPCTQVCPVGATFVSPDGVVLVDKEYCWAAATVYKRVHTVAALSTRKRTPLKNAHFAITASQKA
jgi:tetrathionate reductase subunit B